MSNFSARLIELKNEKKLLQRQIAEDNDISLRAYRYYEKGEREPTLTILLTLADYFGVSLDYLTGRTDNPEINK